MGADSWSILRFVSNVSLRLAALGLLLGFAGSLALRRVMQGMIYGVQALDPWTYGLGIAAVLVLVLAATSIPAFRAARIHPASVLRGE